MLQTLLLDSVSGIREPLGQGRTSGTGLDPPHLELGTDWLLLPAPFSPGFPSSSSVNKEFWNWNDAQPSVDQTVLVSNPVPLLEEQ